MRQDPLGGGLGELIAALQRAEASTREAQAFGSDPERGAGYVQLMRALIVALEAEVLQDPDFPYFRIGDFWQRWAGDNPDQRYAYAPVRGGERYRIWGRLGSARRVELQLYAGRPWSGAGRSVGYLAFEELSVEEGGDFEVELVPGTAEAGQLHNPPEASWVYVRQVYDDWSEDYAGEVHIDRVGHEGRRQPPVSGDEVARRLGAAAESFEKLATVWPDFVAERYTGALPANSLGPLHDSYAGGGVRGRWMASGHYALEPGTALVVRMPRVEADYQAIQLADPWFASLEYGNQVSSLCGAQSLLAPDGAYHLVVSGEDPGYPNWLDTGAFSRGVLLLRYDGVEGAIPAEQHPSTRVLPLGELAAAIPGFERVDAEERERVRRERRRHLQIRLAR